MSGEQIFRWTDGRLQASDPEESSPRVLVADSWATRDGTVIGMRVHRDRFDTGVSLHAPQLSGELDAFWEAVAASIPSTGSFFPRVEVVEGAAFARLRFRLRAMPPVSDSATLVAAGRDPRTQPLVKGPDLAALGVLRNEARASGATEAVIISPDGLVVEGAYSSIVWWRGDALCVVDETLPRLPGVTERTLRTLALALGVTVHEELMQPDDLDGLEIWLLDSLNGIRIVTDWAGGPSPAEQPGRLRTWRTRLAALAR